MNDAIEEREPPEGFRRHHKRSPYMDHNGPFFVKGAGHDLVMGTYINEHQVNHAGIAHGGFLATLADASMAYAIASLTDPPGTAITVTLNIDYVGTAKLGDWIESKVDLYKPDGRLRFASVFLVCNGKRILHASAVLSVNNSD